MKQIIFIIVFSPLIFLFWCNKSIDSPEIFVTELTWSILVETSDTILPWEYWYYIDKDSLRKTSYITWYGYSYRYDDLWLKIEIAWWYGDYSYKKTTWEILKKVNNIIYYGDSPKSWDYIEVFYKNPKSSFETEVIRKHLSKWCSILTGIFNRLDALYPTMQWFEFIHITSLDGNLASNGEIFDKQFPNNGSFITFFIDPKKPDKYYKLSHNDCAPGPCSIFGNIEFF